MSRFLYRMSCFLYGVLTGSVLPYSLSDNKSLYRFPTNLSCGFSQAHRGIWRTPSRIVCCVSTAEMPLSLPHKPKSPHLVSPRYHLSSEDENRNLTRLDALKSIWVFSALSLLLFRLRNLPPHTKKAQSFQTTLLERCSMSCLIAPTTKLLKTSTESIP